MAIGDIVQFGYIEQKYINNNSGVLVTSNYGWHNYYISIDYAASVSLKVILEPTTSTSDEPLQWIEYSLNGKKMYIARDISFGWINTTEAIAFVNSHPKLEIDGIKYGLEMLPSKVWNDLPDAVLQNILLYNARAIITNTCSSSGLYDTVKTTGGPFTINGQVSADTDIEFVPVLVQVNNPPKISGSDVDLGDKTSSFSVSYTVSDDDKDQELTVYEKLNGTIIRTLQNPIQDSTLTFTITDELFASLSMNTTNTIEIEVTDGSATTYRRYTFIKTNSAPLINYTGQSDLGQLTSKPTITYSVSDNEGDTITVTEKLNGEVIKQFTATSNTNYTITITDEFWLSCGSDTNTIEIEASDANGGTSYKYITFTRQVNKVQIVTKNPIETDVAATKIMVSPDYSKTGCTIKIEVCNNGYDASPTWEDMTTMAALNRPYVFTNSTKTAAKWGIKIRLTLTKNEGYTGEVAIYGFGGAFE